MNIKYSIPFIVILLLVPFAVFPPQEVFAAQFGRPSSDISNAGGWSDTDGDGLLWNELEESVSDDSTTVVESGSKPSTFDTFKVKLSSVTDPQTGSGHVYRYTANKLQGAQSLTIQCNLDDGIQLIHTGTTNTLSGSGWQSFSETLTTAEADAISNYGDLRVRCIPETGGGGGKPAIAQVSWIEFEAPDAPQPTYVLDQLDVYESSSTTLGSGTSVCLAVDLETSSTCGTDLVEGNTYRFEIQVRNDGSGSGSPTSFEMRNVVGTNDVFGSILDGDLGSSGCATNTDWTASVSGTDVQVLSGTTCSIAGSGTEEFWFIVTLDTDTADGTDQTFFVTDGSISDTSTQTSFTVISGASQQYTVTSLDVYESESTTLDSGNPICTSISLTSPSTCDGILQVGHVYRFEVTVSEDNGVAGTPTTLDLDSIVGEFKLAGSITDSQITDSGCQTNTDWTESIVSPDIRTSSGTGCTINSSSADFWIVFRLHSDAGGAIQPDVTFTIDDGTVSDTSTITTFQYVIQILE